MSRSRPRAVHLAPAHVPFDTRVFHKEARSLVEAGYDVAIIAVHDRAEMVDGVEIIPLPRARSRFDRFVRNTLRAFRVARARRADVYHLHDPEMLPVGALLSLLGDRVIYDSHEDLPKLVRDRPWIPRSLRPAASAATAIFERLVMPLFVVVISAEDCGARRFPAGKTHLVRNYALPSELQCAVLSPFTNRERVAIFVGALSYQRGAVQMMQAIAAVQDLGARLTLIGSMNVRGMEADLRSRPEWSVVDYLGVGDRETVWRELVSAQVGLVILQPTRKYAEGAVPVKLFEYMAAGLPVVASDFPALRDVVEDAGCGILVDPSDIDSIAKALRYLFENPSEAEAMGARGKAAVLGRYSWSSEAPALLGAYERALR
jgi:glycosyltransferase involved in cell wall biosynthesis